MNTFFIEHFRWLLRFVTPKTAQLKGQPGAYHPTEIILPLLKFWPYTCLGDLTDILVDNSGKFL